MAYWSGVDHCLWHRVSCLLGAPFMSELTVSIIPLYLIVRRPTHILDFSLTLVFLHLVFTTYTARALPLSIFFWVVVAFGAIVMITVAEQVGSTEIGSSKAVSLF